MTWLDDSAWRYFWHPVCTLAELETAAAESRPLAVTLLGEAIAVARIAGTVAAFPDRCIHRSTRLTVGCVEAGGLRCAYHGWLYDADGACVEIPAMPDFTIPPSFRLRRIEAQVAYDLVWLRLEAGAGTRIPECPAWGDDAFRCVQGAPYTWPTSAGRRLENFVDLAHFPFVHDGSLGDRRHTTVPIADIARVGGELRFRFEPEPDMDLPDVALMAPTDYRLWMPFTVNLEFAFPDGERGQLWMAASPVATGTCRSFWFTSRTADRDGDDRPHLEFQKSRAGRGSPGDRGAGAAGDSGSGRREVRADRRGLAGLPPLAARAFRRRREGGSRGGPEPLLRVAASLATLYVAPGSLRPGWHRTMVRWKAGGGGGSLGGCGARSISVATVSGAPRRAAGWRRHGGFGGPRRRLTLSRLVSPCLGLSRLISAFSAKKQGRKSEIRRRQTAARPPPSVMCWSASRRRRELPCSSAPGA